MSSHCDFFFRCTINSVQVPILKKILFSMGVKMSFRQTRVHARVQTFMTYVYILSYLRSGVEKKLKQISLATSTTTHVLSWPVSTRHDKVHPGFWRCRQRH